MITYVVPLQVGEDCWALRCEKNSGCTVYKAEVLQFRSCRSLEDLAILDYYGYC